MRNLRLVLPLWVLCGCLVTDPIDFENENYPPVLVSHPSGTPIGSIVTIPVDDVQRTETTFRVLVRDRNRGQRLIGRYRILTLTEGNQTTVTGDASEVRIPETSEEIELEFPLSHSVLVGGAGQCARLDLFVSSGFPLTVNPDRAFQPVEDGDLAKASWWIWQVSDETPRVDTNTCPKEDVQEDTAVQQPRQP